MVDQESKKDNDVVKYGIIGFFDILGYGSLLENNEPEEIYNEVYPIIKKFPEFMRENIKVHKKSYDKLIDIKKDFLPIINHIEISTFADTILITFDLSKLNQTYNGFYWSIFLSSCAMLKVNMFKKGLPLRGVINYGKYILEKDFFAGNPIVEAYKISKDLELSACVLTTQASKKFNKDIEVLKTKGFKLVIIPFLNYLIPRKKSKQYMNTLCARVEECEEDKIRTVIMDSFGSHYKDIKNSVLKKIDNTEKWLIYRRRNFDTKVDELKQKLNK